MAYKLKHKKPSRKYGKEFDYYSNRKKIDKLEDKEEDKFYRDN